MPAIEVLYVQSLISRKGKDLQQELLFFLRIANLGYEKKIRIQWAGKNRHWRILGANFHSVASDGREYWVAQAKFKEAHEDKLPGDIEFAVYYRVYENEFWEDNAGHNYRIKADSGVRLFSQMPLMILGQQSHLKRNQKYVQIHAAVHESIDPQKVYLHWTADQWKTTRQTPLFCRKNYWKKNNDSNAANPNQYGYGIWTTRLKVGNDFRMEYALACEGIEEIFWDNNVGENYKASRDPLTILILNLHCYQEKNQNFKLQQIAKAIQDLDIDIICFQEVAENWNDGNGDWESNSAKIIWEHVGKPYKLYTDFSHLGFDRYREGVAILSKFPFLAKDSKYISDSDDIYSIHSRKVVMGQVEVPGMGVINVFSVHASWWEDGFQNQFENLRAWAKSKHSSEVVASFLCGDFNIKAGSEGYAWVRQTQEYGDQYLKATSPDTFARVFSGQVLDWKSDLEHDGRIDYIFMENNSLLNVMSGRELFTEQDYGRVSDHIGYLMSFEPK
ncbi:MAG: endonuclease/exonuclease/phosphatase family protein [SAR324 cluster bacterium]|nr:endonuclease/exonuclease/phosphatase family protein [SAR324 cluster bacterium]